MLLPHGCAIPGKRKSKHSAARRRHVSSQRIVFRKKKFSLVADFEFPMVEIAKRIDVAGT
jgi:hypothetical protein